MHPRTSSRTPMAGDAGGPVPSLRAHLLGPVRLAVGDREIRDDAWPRRAARLLLLLLLATPGHRIPRERALDLLWPEAAPNAGRAALRQALHALRRVLEPDVVDLRVSAYLDSDAETIALRPGAWVDVDAFEAVLVGAAAQPPAERRAALREAVALYRGDLLDDEPRADWAVARREHLRRTWERTVLDLADLDLAAGEPSATEPVLEALLAADPTREAAHRALMRAYAAAEQRDRALRQYLRCREALRNELGVEPDAATQALAAALQEPAVGGVPYVPGTAGQPTPPPVDNLPAPPTPLVGRAHELAALEELLCDSGVRLVTLTGPGGVGKTRLAIEAATRLRDDRWFAHGVAFVPLAAIQDPKLVATTIVGALGLRVTPGQSPETFLGRVLRGRQLLLVLDNFEHLVAAATLVADLLAAAARLTVLVTSRQPLRLRGEHELPVAPLAVPDPARLPALRVVQRYAAIALFAARVRAVRPGFAVSEENARVLAEVCARLDGLPLALELAAARLKHLTLEALRRALAHRLELLTGGPRDLPARLRTMRDAIAWSHDLLTPAEQTLFRRLSVFAGGCTLDVITSAEFRVLSAEDEENSALDLLTSLVDKSLVHLSTQHSALSTRYGMLETIQEFGLEQLAAAGEADATRRAHATYYLAFAEQARAAYEGAVAPVWLDRMEAELGNLRAALAWLERSGDADGFLTLAAAIGPFWSIRSFRSEGRGWLARALARADGAPAATRARALNRSAALAFSHGDYEPAAELAEAAMTHWRELGDAWGTAAALNLLGAIARGQGAFDQAERRFTEALALFEALGDRAYVALARCNLGVVAYLRGDLAGAAAGLEAALARYRELADPWGLAIAESALALVACDQGDHARAAVLLGESLAAWREVGTKEILADWLARAATSAAARGQAEQTVRLFAATEALCDTIGYAFERPERARYDRAVEDARAALGEAAFAAAWAAGSALTLDQAIAKATARLGTAEGTSPNERDATAEAALTPRELTVLRLLAEGRSDREIAATLAISRRTVSKHVARILAKFAAPTRGAAAVQAVRRGLI